MIIIGERINGGFKDIVQAIKEKDKSIIEKWARKQTEIGADYIDVNIGAVSNKVEDFLWMIETVQNTVDTPISIDSNKIEFVKRALEICVKSLSLTPPPPIKRNWSKWCPWLSSIMPL